MLSIKTVDPLLTATRERPYAQQRRPSTAKNNEQINITKKKKQPKKQLTLEQCGS